MDHQQVDEQQIAERYLLGKLSVEETEGFEQHLLYCRACQERVEATEAMIDGLRGLVQEK